MARKKEIVAGSKADIVNNLTNLIPKYAENKHEMDTLKKVCDKENAQIKSFMKEIKQDKFEAGDYVANYSVQNRTNVNEEKLLEVLKNVKLNEAIKTREYVDFDVLEDLIYKDKVNKQTKLEIDNCNESKQVEVLKITKKQEDK